MKSQVCFTTGSGKFGIITLTQEGLDSFSVSYGLQIKTKLPYAKAATELGACIMHAAASEGKLVSDPK